MSNDEKIPQVMMDPKDFEEIKKRLDELEKKVENTNAELFQIAGKKVGRDIGILYGLVIGIILSYILPALIKIVELLSIKVQVVKP
ncbi:tetrahydromethanopterin S-methyltransferase subunit MtrG [Methanocaldococcus infernus]|uniref:Tetrahydromethanopterin S-methyltransferase subunit G n=1 Tax=Methanocaldococcus infernus (strain DSM 11812 / JCM 15783 / ME) TaxID=573063 RepID=D5VQU1_METIM|nr:tetrahydromethanopterin S-methyltransferase subunit G [Methanocaldococcus infernus]ADG12944.1 tetrahydromethanopterin S-methyltransferase, subunit G [Methanocaldococcus infernus ME]